MIVVIEKKGKTPRQDEATTYPPPQPDQPARVSTRVQTVDLTLSNFDDPPVEQQLPMFEIKYPKNNAKTQIHLHVPS